MVDFETVMSGLCDEFPFFQRRRFITACVLATIFFILGIPQTTQVFRLSNHLNVNLWHVDWPAGLALGAL